MALQPRWAARNPWSGNHLAGWNAIRIFAHQPAIGKFSYVIGAGNQSILGVEDYLEALLTRPEVTAFGIYLESLRDIPQFAKAAVKALDRNIPLVVLKVGRSDLAARTTLTHTGLLRPSSRLDHNRAADLRTP